MMPTKILRPRARRLALTRPTNRTRTLLKAIALLLLVCASAPAQTAKLPTPDKIINDYVKAVGGRKRLAALRDAT